MVWLLLTVFTKSLERLVPYKYAFVSCMEKTNINHFGFNVVNNNFARLVHQGDFVYITGRKNTWGVSPSVSIGSGAVSADMQPYFEQSSNIPGISAIFDSNIPIAFLHNFRPHGNR